MVLLSRRRLLLFLAVVCFIILGLGIFGYQVIRTSSGPEPGKAQQEAETLLYLSFTGTALALLIGITTYRKSRNLEKEMDKLINLNRFNDFSPSQRMQKMGPFGEKVAQLYHRMNMLSEKKSLKISALGNLNSFLAGNIAKSLLVLDSTGRITYTSRTFLEKNEKLRSDIIGSDITAHFPDLNFYQILSELKKSHTGVEIKREKQLLQWLPIHNRNNEIDYIVMVQGSQDFLTEILSRPQSGDPALSETAKRSSRSFLRDFTRKRISSLFSRREG